MDHTCWRLHQPGGVWGVHHIAFFGDVRCSFMLVPSAQNCDNTEPAEKEQPISRNDVNVNCAHVLMATTSWLSASTQLGEKSSTANWLGFASQLFGPGQPFEEKEKTFRLLAAEKNFVVRAVRCIQQREDAHLIALEVLLGLCTATAFPWEKHNFHQICIGLCFSGSISQRVLASKCLHAMAVHAASRYRAMKLMHDAGVTQWAIRSLRRHASKHDRPESFIPAVSTMTLLLSCKGAREEILSAKVPATLQQIQSTCRLSVSSVNAYSALLRSMQNWLVQPRRVKRVMPAQAPVTASAASKAYAHLQEMAKDAGVDAASEDRMDTQPSTQWQGSAAGVHPPTQGAAGAASQSSPVSPHTPVSTVNASQLQDLREAGLDVDALPASLLHLFMDGGAQYSSAAGADPSSDSDSD